LNQGHLDFDYEEISTLEKRDYLPVIYSISPVAVVSDTWHLTRHGYLNPKIEAVHQPRLPM
jgi:hypothetical protein